MSDAAHVQTDYDGCPEWPCPVHPKRPRALLTSADFILDDGTSISVHHEGTHLKVVGRPGRRLVAGSEARNSLAVILIEDP